MLTLRPKSYRDIVERIAERLRVTACETVLREGDTMPDFVLPDADGELVLSEEMRALGPLVVCFFRGDWCPFCRATLTAMQDVVPQIQSAGASLVALTPDIGGFVQELRGQLGLTFPILSDTDSAVAVQFGAAYHVPADYRQVFLGFGIDLAERHGNGPGLLAMPGTFIADQDGILRFVYVSGDVTDRAEPHAIVDAVQRISQAQFVR